MTVKLNLIKFLNGFCGWIFFATYLVILFASNGCGSHQVTAGKLSVAKSRESGKISGDATIQMEKPRIAIVAFTNLHPVPEMQGAEKRLATNLEARLQQSKRFVVVERGQLELVLEEHRLSKEGITQTLRAGKKLPPLEGLDYLVTGTLSGDALSTEATVKFISVGKAQTGVIAQTFTAKGITTPAVLQSNGQIIRQLIAAIRGAFPLWGSIVNVQGKRVTLSPGAAEGIQVGDAFEVVLDDIPVGKLEVIEVQKEQSIAKPVKTERPLARGMRVRTLAPPRRSGTDATQEAAPAAETLIAILPFQNYTGDPALDWIGKGISASLTTMMNTLEGFRLVERQQLDQLLAEQRLQASALFDPQTVVEAGRLWKTRYLILGGYQKLREFYRLDGWRVDTETGQVFEAQGIVGQELFALQQELGQRLSFAIDRNSAALQKSPSKIEGITIGVRIVETIPTAVYHLLPTLHAPLVEYTLENATERAYTLSVSTEIAGYTHLSTETVELPASGVRVVYQTPAFQTERLASLVQQRTASLNLRVAALTDEAGQVLFEQQRTVTLLPYNTLLWSLESADGQRIDLLPALAAWVSPNSPTVAKLLREAADYTPSHRIAGYQNPTLLAMADSDKRKRSGGMQCEKRFEPFIRCFLSATNYAMLTSLHSTPTSEDNAFCCRTKRLIINPPTALTEQC